MFFDDFVTLLLLVLLIVIFFIGTFKDGEKEKIEIQEIKQVDNGYYITIDNEIYYKEV